MTPSVLVFDIGNVLVDWQPARVFEEILGGPPEDHPIWPDLMAMNARGDLGRLEAEVEALAAARPAEAEIVRTWRARWGDMFGPEMPGSYDVLRAGQAAGLRLAALSNFAADTYEIAKAEQPILGHFEVEVISGREGVMKPDPAIYALIEARTGATGAQLFFTDDKLENTEAAKARGWHAHQFKGAEGLRAALQEVGVAL